MSLPEITDEDRALGLEAHRVWEESGFRSSIGAIAAALARTGRKPVDPDLILAREVAADIAADFRWHGNVVDAMRRGIDDTDRGVQTALAAIKAVRRERERKG